MEATMQLRQIPWEGACDPGEGALRLALEAEGFEVHAWRDPADRIYANHHHDCDESLWLVRGSLLLRVDEREYLLGPGDRLLLPRGVPHSARAGPDGATYLIGQRKEAGA
jgi:mannose-6-phosphate isomerase-like protein (cupin superfamily)